MDWLPHVVRHPRKEPASAFRDRNIPFVGQLSVLCGPKRSGGQKETRGGGDTGQNA